MKFLRSVIEAESFDHLPAMVMVSNADGVVERFNQAWRDFTGDDSTSAWAACIHPDDVERVATDWAAAVARGATSISMEYRLREASTGSYRWFAARARAMRRDETIIGWVGVAVDVHDRKTSEAQLLQLYFDERAVAEGFQTASLPRIGTSIGGLEIDATYLPGTVDLLVGGDWYDAYVLPDSSLLLCVGDVVGHGLQAAITMSKIRQSIRTLAFRNPDDLPSPSAILKATEATILAEYGEMMATALIGIVDPARKKLVYCSAGHPPAFIRRHGKVFETSNGGTPLGLAFGASRPDYTADLSGVDLLFLYTDGLLESHRDYLSDEHRLRQLLLNWADDVHGICNASVAAIASESTRDDIALIAVAF